MISVRPKVAVVDFGLGNLFSVQQACQHVGLEARITVERAALLAADAIILPGVGAFGDAMATLHRLDLVSVLRDVASSPKPLVGICLGVQLLMSESQEFGRHKGLGILEGPVVRMSGRRADGARLKVPQVGWNRIAAGPRGQESWQRSLLDGVADGEFMYFVHSFVVQPVDPRAILSTTRYGDVEFCSSVRRGNVFACQFHPERSGEHGLRIYRNLAMQLKYHTFGVN